MTGYIGFGNGKCQNAGIIGSRNGKQWGLTGSEKPIMTACKRVWETVD